MRPHEHIPQSSESEICKPCGRRDREQWLRSVRGEAQRIGRIRSANWDALAPALARRGKPAPDGGDS